MKSAFLFSILAATAGFADEAVEVVQEGQVIVKKLVQEPQEASENAVEVEIATQEEIQK